MLPGCLKFYNSLHPCYYDSALKHERENIYGISGTWDFLCIAHCMHYKRKIYIICTSGRADHFQPLWKKTGLHLAADWKNGIAGSVESKKYPYYIYSDRNADGTLASGRNDSCDHLLYGASDKTVYIFIDDLSSELSDLSTDRNCLWNSGNDRCSLRNNGIGAWNPAVDDWWCNPFRSIFWRPLFTCFNKCASGGRADRDRHLQKYKKYDKKCGSAIPHYLPSLSDRQHAASWKD